MSDTAPKAQELPKVASLIRGLDSVLLGGFPKGRATLLSGGPGTGKSVLALEFLYRHARLGEPGIFVSFEERADALRQNAATLGWDLESLERAGKLFLMEARVDPDAVLSGDFSIKGLLAILDGKAKSMGASLIAFDALDVLMRLFDSPSAERNQMYTLNNWLLDHSMTTLLTAKASESNTILPRYEFLEFMADCVIRIGQHPTEQVSARDLQVLKYRGSDFGRNAYPFVITGDGLYIVPISTFDLQHKPLGKHLSTGNSELDKILGGGYRQASSVLIAGTSGTGKTTLASTFVESICRRGDRVLYLGYEESQEAMLTGMLSSGIDLRPAIKAGKLRVATVMPESMGTEQHLVRAFNMIEDFKPDHVIVDAISAFKRMGTDRAAFEFAMRLINTCKEQGITVLTVAQSEGFTDTEEVSGLGISSITDTVIFLRHVESGGELNRVFVVMKSRGSKHSNQFREFRITDHGIEIASAFSGEGGVLTGTARQEQEQREYAERRLRARELRQKQLQMAAKRAELEAETSRIRADLDRAESELDSLRLEAKLKEEGHKERGGIRESGTDAVKRRAAIKGKPAGAGRRAAR